MGLLLWALLSHRGVLPAPFSQPPLPCLLRDLDQKAWHSEEWFVFNT